jgi:hypothetical protein
MQSGGGQIVTSVQVVAQCALGVSAKQHCHLDFMNKEFFWLIVSHSYPVLECGILSVFSGLSLENRDGHCRWGDV